MKTTKHRKSIPLFTAILSLLILIPFNNLNAAETTPPAIVLSSYSISGNALTDDFILLHLVLANTGQNLNINNALISYKIVSENNTFFPAYGNTNQFIIPSIKANSTFEYDLKISVRNVIPDNVLHLDFTATYFDANYNMSINDFYINYVFKDTEAVQLLGIEAVKAEKLSDNYSVTSFKAIVINHSGFLVQDVIMDLQGKNFDFSASIPLNNINSDDYIIRYFNSNFTSDDIPEFTAKFHYVDVDGFKYESHPQTFKAYLNINELQNAKGKINPYLKTAIFVVIVLSLIAASIILLVKFSRKKSV